MNMKMKTKTKARRGGIKSGDGKRGFEGIERGTRKGKAAIF